MSVSSMRSTKVPWFWRENSTLLSDVLAVPRCAKPVGLGAILTRTDTAISYGRVGNTRVARPGRGRRVQPRQRGARPDARRRCEIGDRVRRADRGGQAGSGAGRRARDRMVRAVRPGAAGAAGPQAG